MLHQNVFLCYTPPLCLWLKISGHLWQEKPLDLTSTSAPSRGVFLYISFGCGSFRTGGSGAVERKMDLSYYGSSEGILGLGSWVGQNNLTRKTERLDCWDLLT